MTSWRPTPALVRASLLALGGLAGAVVLGLAVLVVVAAPFVVPGRHGAGLARPRQEPGLRTRIDHHRLHEGQGTTSRLELDDATGVEHVTRVAAPVPPRRDAADPRRLRLARRRRAPRPWASARAGGAGARSAPSGWRSPSAWAGWRWGPVDLPEHGLSVLPQTAPYDSRAEVPQPDGLVGRHRSRRIGSGTEFEGIRRFAAGDRLKRITWPVSLRTGELHVITTRAEQDAGVWLVVDGLRDIGVSGGIDGAASTLDLTVRAAAALAEHHVRTGDRVGLLVVAADGARVRLGSGPRHLHRLHGTLARVRTEARSVPPERLDLGAGAGSVVYVLSPMLVHPARRRDRGRCSAVGPPSSSSTPSASAIAGDRPARAGQPRRADAEDRARRPARAAGRPRVPGGAVARPRHRSTRCCTSSPAARVRPGCGGRDVAGLTHRAAGVERPVLLLRAPPARAALRGAGAGAAAGAALAGGRAWWSPAR